MNNKILKFGFYTLLTAFVGVLAFFIVYNAQWLVGDDAIIIRHTGWGHFFSPADTVSPSAGRFFPLSYFVYNILYFLQLTSVEAHFGLMALTFICMSIVATVLAKKSITLDESIWTYLSLFALVAVCIQRSYSNYLDAFSTIWFGYFWILLWCLLCYYVHAKQSKIAAVLGFLVITYFSYCGETIFVFPLSYGICGLIFSCKNASKLEKNYMWSLVCTAIIFLVIYFFTCFIHIEQAYDGAHGSEITLFGNAIKMLIAQKVLCLGLVVFAWRQYCIWIKKEQYEFWDTMMWAGFGFCCGCAVLKLNWVLYYSQASIFMLPAIAHYLDKYLGKKWAAIILVCLALFMCRTLPKYIKDNQKGRLGTTEQMNIISEQYNNGQTFYWYEPTDDREWCFDMELRAWLRECLQTQIGWQVENEDFRLNVITEFCDSTAATGVYFVTKQNEKLFPEINEQVINAGIVLHGDKERDIQTILIK